MTLTDEYINYISTVRRYSPRTCEIYKDALERFCDYIKEDHEAGADLTDTDLLSCLTHSIIRSYEVHLMDGGDMTPRTVNLHLSVLSGFCKFLVRKKLLPGNPLGLITRPKVEKRLPHFYRSESMEEYFRRTDPFVAEDTIYVSPEPGQTQKMYEQRLRRLIVSMLFSTGMRRSELINLSRSDVDFGRRVVKVLGKGDKMREIPIIEQLYQEILLYLRAVDLMTDADADAHSPMLLTYGGKKLYPVYIDRAVKAELGEIGSITGRKSPHVLRHSLATELLNEGADLNYIKQLLGHSSLAATQVYTHNSIAKMKKVYESAHPRAKKGGNHGD
ncbi:MAG: tyrosine-type recombinase/integrase [Bacteroidales bacterium]|nr:tyrosine-type recombinase/integrase [Bacteroidales bacterium]